MASSPNGPSGDVFNRLAIHGRFNELFSHTMGLTPKQFAGVMRFQSALRFIEGAHDFDWPDVVDAGGFYDQAQMIHEFQKHGGLAPERYLRDKTPKLNHPLVDAG